MTLWFVFALMTAAAIFAVLWPLSRRGRPQNDGSEATVYKDQLAEIDRDLAAGLIGASEAEAARVEISRRLLAAADRPARAADRIEHQVAPRRGDGGAGRAADRVGGALPAAGLAAPRRFSAGANAPARRTPTSRSTIWWRRSKRIWRKIRPMAAAGTCLRRCWRGSAATTMRCGPIAIRSPIMATAPSAGPISAKPLPARRAASSRRRPRPNSNAPSRSTPDEVKARYFLGLAAAAGRPQRRGGVDLARDAGKGAGRCAVASAGSGRFGPGRRFGGAGAAGRCRGRGART